MLTGEKVKLFLDRDAIAWGDNWLEKIDLTLSLNSFLYTNNNSSFFYQLCLSTRITIFCSRCKCFRYKGTYPTYTLRRFSPLFMTKTREMILLSCIRTFQWEDWHDIRFKDVTSEEYRRGVFKLASQLVEANKHAEVILAPLSVGDEVTSEVTEDDLPGAIDLLANSEEKLIKLPETLKSISQYISQIGEIMNEATVDINRSDTQGKGFGARLMIARRISSQLREPTDQIYTLVMNMLLSFMK